MKAAAKTAKKKAAPARAASTAVRGPTSASASFNTATSRLCKLYPVAAEYLHDLDPALRLPTQQAYSVVRDGRTKYLNYYYDLGCILEPIQAEFKQGGIAAMHAALLNIDKVNAVGIDVFYHAIRFARLCDHREAERLFSYGVAWSSVRHLITIEDPAVRREMTEKAVTQRWSAEVLEHEIKQLRAAGNLPGGRVQTDAKLGRSHVIPGPPEAKLSRLSEQVKRTEGTLVAISEPLHQQMAELQTMPVSEWPEMFTNKCDGYRKQLRQLRDLITAELQHMDAFALAASNKSAAPAAATAAAAGRVNRPPRSVSPAGVSR